VNAPRVTKGALHDVRVIELMSGLPGQLAGMHLADFGADVIKIEPIKGDPRRADAGFAVWNRGKRSITASSDVDRERISALLAGADVCVLNSAMKYTEGLVDLDRARRVNPGLVVLDVPPSEGSALWRGNPDSEGLLCAATGVALRQSSFDGGPVDVVSPMVLHLQGLLAAVSTVAALVEQRRSGHGQDVTVTGVHAMAFASAGSLTKDAAQTEQRADVGPGGPNPFYTRYLCSDGQWLFVGALVHPVQLRYLEAVGLSHLLADQRSGGDPAAMILPEHRHWVREQFSQTLKTRTREQWMTSLAAADVPYGPLLTQQQWFDHPQIAAQQLRVEMDDPERGAVSMPGVFIHAEGTPAGIRRAAPMLGQHNAEVTAWQPRPRPHDRPPALDGPLAGFRILNLGTYLAGPYAGALLRELGADVVKVESLAGDPFRVSGFTYNRGMRSVAIDLRTDDGRKLFYELVLQADVVVDNARTGVLERLGVDHGTLARQKPDIVTCSVTAFGSNGPLAHRPAFDPVLQAMSGLMLAQGGDDEPVMVTISINDVTSAALCALAACIGLYHRQQTGVGQRLATSLAAAAVYVQSGELVDSADRPPPRRGGRDFVGEGRHKYHRVSDGWVRVELDDDVDEQLVDESRLATETRRAALERLGQQGVAAASVRPFSEVRTDPELRRHDLVHEFRRSDGSCYTTPGRFAAFSRTPQRGCFTVAGVGEHTLQVLNDWGVDLQLVQRCLVSGVVAQGGPYEPLIFNYR
jgi:crotonobetainyl-CoA:carnitine CoA-transferase CaiB-like acyl-CoA transferase